MPVGLPCSRGSSAEVERADKPGRTPLDAAKHLRHDAIVALLEEHYTTKFPLHAAAKAGDVYAMALLSTPTHGAAVANRCGCDHQARRTSDGA